MSEAELASYAPLIIVAGVALAGVGVTITLLSMSGWLIYKDLKRSRKIEIKSAADGRVVGNEYIDDIEIVRAINSKYVKEKAARQAFSAFVIFGFTVIFCGVEIGLTSWSNTLFPDSYGAIIYLGLGSAAGVLVLIMNFVTQYLEAKRVTSSLKRELESIENRSRARNPSTRSS